MRDDPREFLGLPDEETPPHLKVPRHRMWRRILFSLDWEWLILIGLSLICVWKALGIWMVWAEFFGLLAIRARQTRR